MLKKDDYFKIVESLNFHQEQAEEINIKIEEGVIGPIIEGGIQTFTLDLLLKLKIPKTKGGKSALVIPLSIEDDIVGVIYLESHVNDFFREENELLQILSSEAAAAINRVQLKEESERLQYLKKIGDEIRKGDFSQYMNTIVETTRKVLHSEVSTIFTFQKADRTLIRKAWAPQRKELKEIGEVYTEMSGITGTILEYKENTHIICNYEKYIREHAVKEHLEKYECLPSWKKKKNKSLKSSIQHIMLVPIVGEKGMVFGALRVMNKTSRSYSDKNPELDNKGFQEPEDVELLKTIASLLSQGLSSERKAEKLQMLREITKEVS